MERKLAQRLWIVAVVLYATGFGWRFAHGGGLRAGDAIGPIMLVIVGWSVFRKSKT